MERVPGGSAHSPAAADEPPGQRSRLRQGLEWAAQHAYTPGEYVGQEGFVTAGDALALVRAAGVTRGSRLLDLCCGMGGMGLYIARQIGCNVVGVDLSPEAIRCAAAAAREPTWEGAAEYVLGDANAVPLAGGFDAVLLLEVQMAFRNKLLLLREINRLLRHRGRLALTFEDAEPLTASEQHSIPDGDTVWLTPAAHFIADLTANGFGVVEQFDRTVAQLHSIQRLLSAFTLHGRVLVAMLGVNLYRQLCSAFEHWQRWLGSGRVRSVAVVAERIEACGL